LDKPQNLGCLGFRIIPHCKPNLDYWRSIRGPQRIPRLAISDLGCHGYCVALAISSRFQARCGQCSPVSSLLLREAEVTDDDSSLPSCRGGKDGLASALRYLHTAHALFPTLALVSISRNSRHLRSRKTPRLQWAAVSLSNVCISAVPSHKSNCLPSCAPAECRLRHLAQRTGGELISFAIQCRRQARESDMTQRAGMSSAWRCTRSCTAIVRANLRIEGNITDASAASHFFCNA